MTTPSMYPALSPSPVPGPTNSQSMNSNSHTAQPDYMLRDQPEDVLPAQTMNIAQTTTPPEQSQSPAAGNGSDISDGGDGQENGKGYGKRELSTSKRAAQNRAAQRAFRQRKETYIKKLEEQVREYQALSENFKSMQAENYQLRDYIISLQSRLLESQGECPPPPSNVDGLQPMRTNASNQPPTLPRIAEMGSSTDTARISSEPRMYESSPKRLKTEMTPSQAALQGSSVLPQPGPTTR